ncbi:MAG: hypothetical protein LBV42_01065 [Methanobrevibacter sp.]|jgi:hypothetical protein|nr:hypothetical protein [Methanobrevibacter sp.]
MNKETNSKEITKDFNEEEFKAFLKKLRLGEEDIFFRFSAYGDDLPQNQFDRNIAKLQNVDKVMDEIPKLNQKEII